MKHFDPSTVPARMQKLDRDRRGLPVPFIVLRDNDGTPHFTINDTLAVQAVLTGKLCSICGQKLDQNMWAIGGPLSAIHQHGAYLDPLVHKDCGTFALRTCPYIALPSWSDTKRIDAKTVDPAKLPAHMLFEDRTMIPERPAFFIFAKTSGYRLSQQGPAHFYVHPNRPWLQMEFWKDGEPISKATARQLFVEKEGYAPETMPYWPKDKTQ